MKGYVYDGPGRASVRTMPDPTLRGPGDVVVAVSTASICASDLRVRRGGVSSAAPGTVLGHEAVGVVVDAGAGVEFARVGTRVLVPAITACGTCDRCGRGARGHCRAIGAHGWVLGNVLDGVHADLVRVPFADANLWPVPDWMTDREAVLLADALPTAYEVGMAHGGAVGADRVAVVGLGPVGLAVVALARATGSCEVLAIGHGAVRRTLAAELGAHRVLDPAHPETITDAVGADGVDLAVEAAGTAAAFDSCTRMVRIGGRVTNIGVHTEPVTLRLDELWSRDLTLSTGLLDCSSLDTLADLHRTGGLRTDALISHEFALTDIAEAYDHMAGADRRSTIKVLLCTEATDTRAGRLPFARGRG